MNPAVPQNAEYLWADEKGNEPSDETAPALRSMPKRPSLAIAVQRVVGGVVMRRAL